MRYLLSLVAVASIAGSASASVLGRLGQAKLATRIYASPNSHARVFYRVRPYEYLVIQKSPNPNYLRVLLQTGIYGYVPASTVAQLPYQVSSGATQSSSRAAGSLASRSGMANYALNFIGTPYKWGGNDEMSGIDCSGFVKKMYGKIGVALPRTAAEQAYVGQPVTRLEDLQKGDRLYFWSSKRGKIGHTGIYMGNGNFVHSSMGHKGVATDVLTESWRRILVAARR